MNTILQDFRYSLRLLRKNMVFSVVAVVTLAFGVGAITLVFSTVNGVLLSPLPFFKPERLLAVHETHPEIPQAPVSVADFNDFREQSQTFAGLAAYTIKGVSNPVLKTGGETDHVQAALCTENLIPLLGIPVAGRNFLPGEMKAGSDSVLILSNRLWRSRFLADPNIVGKVITLDNQNLTVIGVLPAGEQLPEWADVWMPLSHIGPQTALETRQFHLLEVVGRLKPGVSPQQGQTELQTIAYRLQQAYPATNNRIGVSTTALSEEIAGPTKPILLLVLALSGLVLLIVCINIAGLLLARATIRQGETAVRVALGASPMRLLQQFLTESLTLALLGGGIGLLVAALGVPLLRASLRNMLPRVDSIHLDFTVLAFSAAITMACGLVLSLLPAVQSWRPSFYGAFKEGAREAGSVGRSRMRAALVVGEIALAAIVLASTGLVARSVERLLHQDTGFQAGQVIAMKLKLPEYQYTKQEQVDAFYQRLLAQLASDPQIDGAATVDALPLRTTRSRGPASPLREYRWRSRESFPLYICGA